MSQKPDVRYSVGGHGKASQMLSKDKEEIRSKGGKRKQQVYRGSSQKRSKPEGMKVNQGGGGGGQVIKEVTNHSKAGLCAKPPDSGLTKPCPKQRHRNTDDRVARHTSTWAYDQQM